MSENETRNTAKMMSQPSSYMVVPETKDPTITGQGENIGKLSKR